MVVKPNSSSEVRRQWFTVNLLGSPEKRSSISFTITFRPSEDEPWKWANEQFSTSDGRIVYQTTDTPKEDLTYYIDGLPPYLQIVKERSDTPETLLWSITSPVNSASGKVSGYSNNTLGRPTSYHRWFALIRLWSPWLAPRQGKETFRLDKEAILATFQRDDGTHLVILAISGVDDVLTCFYHDGTGSVTINSRNDSEKDGVAKVIAAVGKSLESSIAAAIYHARKVVQKYEVDSGEYDAEMKALVDGVRPEWLENWYDGLSYCTWNGIGQHLTEDKIFTALDSLQKNDINISNLIIDDNWQSLVRGHLSHLVKPSINAS